MATISLQPLLFFFLFRTTLCSSQITELPPSVLLPVSKDGPTGQYLTQIYYGNSTEPTKVVLDLGGPFLWLDCGPSRPNPVHCRSIQCSSVRAHPCSAAGSACSLLLQNPITGSTTSGNLVEDTISAIDQFLFSCAPSILLQGLPSRAKGVLGLGNTRIGASAYFGYPQKFSLCLSSSNGIIFAVKNQPNLGKSEISKSLIYTPLLPGDDYHINLKAIKIQNKKLPLGLLHQVSPSVRISTVTPYGKMETRIYEVFVKAFVMAAESSNMIPAPAVAPFMACYVAGSGAVPVIDLVLQSEMVKWRIYGHNSMVKVEEDVMCLGFLDGGLNLGASVVLGGHQLEDNLLEFDLGSSMLGFSSSLVMKRTSCSQLSSSYVHQEDVQTL